jgi:hypothetical protein
MVNNCANTGCGKPLHYLREGRIFIFDASAGATEPGAKRLRRLEHYWLCGACAETMMLLQDAQGMIRVIAKPAAIVARDDLAPAMRSALAF